METKYLEQMIRIYNTLLTVSTCGEDTITMGQCLSVMKETLTLAQQEAESKKMQLEAKE